MYNFIYPAFHKPPTSLTFNDQFAFRPTGSTTAAIITLLHKLTHLLLSNRYVFIIALDFSKAFDIVRHHTLLDKMAQLDLPDYVYNWLVHFFEAHSHQTNYQDETSVIKTISASIIQGSAIGPASYVVNSCDSSVLSVGNELCKYGDDTHNNPEPTPINDNDCALKQVPTLLAHTELVDNVAVPAQTELVDCVDSDNTAAMNDNDSLLKCHNSGRDIDTVLDECIETRNSEEVLKRTTLR